MWSTDPGLLLHPAGVGLPHSVNWCSPTYSGAVKPIYTRWVPIKEVLLGLTEIWVANLRPGPGLKYPGSASSPTFGAPLWQRSNTSSPAQRRVVLPPTRRWNLSTSSASRCTLISSCCLSRVHCKPPSLAGLVELAEAAWIWLHSGGLPVAVIICCKKLW